MKGDFSRLRFQTAREYDRVLMQQGRVQLDSDWNAQSSIESRRVRESNLDLIGRSGAGGAGFGLYVRTALAFTRPDQNAAPAKPEVFTFGGHEPFTISVDIMPVAGGVVVSNRSTERPAGWSLTVNPDLTVSFERVEHHRQDEIVQHVWEERIGKTHVTVITDETEKQTVRTVRRVTTHRTLPTGHFSPVLVRYDGKNIEIWIDGKIEARDSHGYSGEPGREPLLIAAGFSGQISELRMWREALRHEACQTPRKLHRAAHGHRLAWFPFDESTGEIARDASGNGHDAQLQCAPDQTPPAWVRELWIEAGRYYVDGVPCSLARDVRFTEQPDSPGAVVPPFDARRILYLAWLESWDRLITTLEDPSIAEPALGGVDTATRVETVAAVRLMPLEREVLETPSDETFPEWDSFLQHAARKGRMAAQAVNRPLVMDNQLLRVEVHQEGWAVAQNGALPVAIPAVADATQSQWWKVDAWTVQGRPWAAGNTVIVSVPGQTFGTAVIGETDAANLRLQLISGSTLALGMTQIHLTPAATFKWSRDNGSTVFPVTMAEGSVLTLENGADDWEIAAADWIEAGDDVTVLRDEPGTYAQIAEFDRVKGAITLRQPPAFPFDSARHPYARRWERPLALVDSSGWIDLDQGVQVRFSADAKFRTGDYWTIPLRSIPQNVEWPVRDNEPVLLEPEGVHRRRCLLALIAVDERGPSVLRSLRRVFQPLTEVAAAEQDFVRRSGDEMTGSLGIDGHLRVNHKITAKSDVQVEGRLDVHGHSKMGHVEVSLLRGELAESIVGTPQIRDGSVTIEKLAFPIEGAAHGFLQLRTSPNPVPGYRYVGPRIVFANPEPLWPKPPHWPMHGGPLRGIVSGHHAFLFSEEGDKVWSLDLRDGRTEPRKAPSRSCRKFALAEVEGTIFMVGGLDGRRSTDWLSAYDPHQDIWTERRPMHHRRFDLAAVGAHGHVYALGGRKRKGIFGGWSDAVEQYHPESDRWTELPAMPTPRSDFGLATHKEYLFAMGGERGVFFGLLGRRVTAANEVFDPAGGWSKREPMPSPRRGLGLASFDGRISAIGGDELSFLGFFRTVPAADHRQFDPALDAWSLAGRLRFPRREAAGGVFGNQLFTIGGKGPGHRSCAVQPVAAVYFGFEPEDE